MSNLLPLWAVANISLPEGRIWDFLSRPWLLQIYQAFDPHRSKEIIIPKSSQGGISTFAIAASLYMAIEVGGINVGYYLPRQDDVSDIVETKVDVMLRQGSQLYPYLKRPSSVRTKKLLSRNGNKPSFIRFAEASVPPRILTLDMVVKDEFDLCNPTYLAQACSRMDSSPFGIVISMSVPYSSGLFSVFHNDSTACEWFITCPHCGDKQVMSWEQSFILDGQPKYVCIKCRKELTPRDRFQGEWVAAYPSRSIDGFHVTQFMYGWRTAGDLYEDSLRMRKADFYSLKLGQMLFEGEALSDEKLFGLLFGAEVFPEEQQSDGESKYYMGADQGDSVFYVIAKRKSESEQTKIVHLGIIPIEQAEEKLEELMVVFDIEQSGIDAEPNRLLPLNLRKKGFPAWSITQSTVIKKPRKIDKLTHEITIQRTYSFDDLFNQEIKSGRWHLFGYPPLSIEVMDMRRRNLVRHLSALRRTPGTPRQTRKALWQSDGAAHFAHALAFMLTVMELKHKRTARWDTVKLNQTLEPEEIEGEENPKNENPDTRQQNLGRRQRSSSRLRIAVTRVRNNSAAGSWPTHPAFGNRY